MPLFQLNSDLVMPGLAYGTYRLEGQKCYDALIKALETGYQHIDTAERYGNEDIIGRVLRDTHVKREEVFLASKVWWNNLHASGVRAACEGSLQKLGVEYLDLYMVHWPNRTIPFQETFTELAALKQEGKIREFGVSNFTTRHLADLEALGVHTPINQVELHPSFAQTDLVAYCHEHTIIPQAHTPLGAGRDIALFELENMSVAKSATRAMLILAWHRAKGNAVVVGASRFETIEQNFQSLAVELTPEEVAIIDGVAQKERVLDRPFADFAYV